MLDIETHFAAIRQKIDHLKAMLQTTTDDVERHEIHACINECIRESMGLMDQQLRSHTADRADGQAAAQDTARSERHAGEHPAAWTGEQ